MAAFGSRLSSSGTLKQVLRSASVAFLDADANNDGVLSFDELKDMLSSTVAEQGTDEEIRDIFDAADENKNGAGARAAGAGIGSEEEPITWENVRWQVKWQGPGEAAVKMTIQGQGTDEGMSRAAASNQRDAYRRAKSVYASGA